MTIRTRVNLWYSAVLCAVALTVMGAALYFEMVIERHHPDQKSEAERNNEELIEILIWTVVPGVLLGLSGGWWITRRALAPVAALTAAAGNINHQNLHRELPRSGNGDELDRLTEVFNAMTARLDDSFRRIREFTLHASHELKTPLTILHGETETALRDGTLSPAQRDFLASHLDELQRLAKIVDGLALLAKADAGLISLKHEELALDEIVRDAFDDAQILARPADVAVTLAECDPIVLHGDRHRLRQLLLNLADNAVKYNRPGGTVGISLRRHQELAELRISNTGKGIAPELLPRVCDRFFRGDPSHNSAVDGCGLGLSIAQWIVSAHHGTLEFTSEIDGLTEVTVRLPLLQDTRESPRLG